MTGRAQILRGDARNLPLADQSVDLICTSPPYWALRSYQDNGNYYDGQLGSERTPGEFVDALIECTRQWMRVLKPSGSMWINLGDKYANRPPGGNFSQKGNAAISSSGRGSRVGSRPMGSDGNSVQGIRDKSLIGIPWRYAIRCIDDLGLILRAEVIWSKPNGLPESVTDRVRRSHETWFHFTKEPRYYSAVDEIREAHTSSIVTGRRGEGGAPLNGGGQRFGADGSRHTDGNPLGKLPGSVWTIPTQPLQVPAWLGIDHFAAFPMEWPRRIIRGWSPAGVCTACGEGRRPVCTALTVAGKPFAAAQQSDRGREWHGGDPAKRTLGTPAADRERTITGYACACPDNSALTIPAIVLDPFGGTGTTALVAKSLGRTGISVDMSADYCRLAKWRTTDPGQMAAALQVEKPEPIHPDQLDLFSEDGAA